MTLIQFLKHYKIDEIISFHKEEIKSESKIKIGWKAANSLDLSKEIVISKSKSSSKKGRITAANIEEYYKYFLAASQKTPEDYLKIDESKPILKEINEDFMKSLALFLVSKEKTTWNKMVTLEVVKNKDS